MANKTMMTLNGANRISELIGEDFYDFQVSIDTPDAAWGDTSLATTVPITGSETVSDCSVTTAWTASAGSSVSVNTYTFKPDGGTDGALNFIKSGTATADINVYKTTTSLDGASKDFTMWFYVKDTTTLAKMSATTALLIRFGSDSSNYYQKRYGSSDLDTGWNFIKLAIPSGFTVVSSPTTAALDYTYIATSTTTATDTYVAGDLVFDAIRLASSDDYAKLIDSVTADTNDGSISVLGKLSVTEANGFLLDGVSFRTNSGTMLVKAKFPSNSKDTTDLFKLTTKMKFRNVNQL